MKKTHPEIYKKGILKKSTREFNAGEHEKAKQTLMNGFKLISLRQMFEPDFTEKQAKRDAKKAQE